MVSEINEKIADLFKNNAVSRDTIKEAKTLYNQGFCQVLSRSKSGIDLLTQTGEEDDSLEIILKLLEGELTCLINNKPSP